MTIEELREWKKELGYSYKKIAELSELPVETVQRVLGGIEKSPEYGVVKELEKVLVPIELQSWPPGIKEETARYLVTKRQGEYTAEDYWALPDERRVELIDGVIYDMSSPIDIHQIIGNEILGIFRGYIRKEKGQCIAVTAPLDVQLDCDNKTIVQPDILIICNRSKFQKGWVFGAPYLTVEIHTPSTRKKDITIKKNKYKNAGVRDYWIVDPVKKRVHVYEFEKEELPVMYTFNDKVPVGIWDNKCEVDFAEIYDYVRFLYAEV